MIELEQYAQDINGIRKSILAAGEALHIDHMREQIEELTEANASNERKIETMQKKLSFAFTKYGLVKYDALEELGGKLSYTLCMLNESNDGYIINVVHSREGCYNYTKEVIDGNSIVTLSGEEEEALEKALSSNK